MPLPGRGSARAIASAAAPGARMLASGRSTLPKVLLRMMLVDIVEVVKRGGGSGVRAVVTVAYLRLTTHDET